MDTRSFIVIGTLLIGWLAGTASAAEITVFDVPDGARPHDVAPAPAPDGKVWYTAQGQGALGILDPATRRTEHNPLGEKSAPHGVIPGPDGAAWITDSGRNAIVRFDPDTRALREFPLPKDAPYTNLNTAAFDDQGRLWFTGQGGYYGSVDPATGKVILYEAPQGAGPYGITATGDAVYYASLAGSHIARIDPATGRASVIDPPTPGQGARRVWADSAGDIWVSEWLSGELSRYSPDDGNWQSWPLPGDDPKTYAIYVDAADKIWVSDFGANAVLRFDPASGTFTSYPGSDDNANVRQIHGCETAQGIEVWLPESGLDRLVRIRLPRTE